jgi:hypothetical protein
VNQIGDFSFSVFSVRRIVSPGRLPDQERFIQIRKLPVDRVTTIALFGCLIESAPNIVSRLRCMKSNSVNLPIQRRCNQACIYTFDDYAADEDWLPFFPGSTRPRVLMPAPRRNDLNLGEQMCFGGGETGTPGRARPDRKTSRTVRISQFSASNFGLFA